MSIARIACRGCVLSDGHFAVLGGDDRIGGECLSSCEALVVDHDDQWEALPSMHMARSNSACAAVAKCALVASGYGGCDYGDLLRPAEAFDEVLGHWLQLPCDLPYAGGLCGMGSALLLTPAVNKEYL
jgi:hypothetical protein